MEFMKAGISPIVPLILILIIWLSFQFYMMKKPLRDLHEGYINRQIGRTAHNHLVLGLSRTKGANVTVVRQDGTLDIHTSYSPLASWVTALPLRFGVPFDAATQGTAIVHVLVFLVAFRTFIYHLYGALRANVALAYAAFFPVVLFFYGRSCIFEVLGLGPLMVGLALLTQPKRNVLVWLSVAVAFLLAVMYSWIFWLVALPCLVHEALDGSRRAAFVIGVIVVLLPVAVHFGTILLASGSLRSFFRHIGERAAGIAGNSGRHLSYWEVAKVLLDRYRALIGSVGLVSTLFALCRCTAGSWSGHRPFWYSVLLVYAIPLNLLMRNLAFHHDFVIILFVPLAALAAAWLTCLASDALPESLSARCLFWGGVMMSFFVCDIFPARHVLARGPECEVAQGICRAIGTLVDPGDFVILSPSFFDNVPGTRGSDEEREMIPMPTYCGQMVQSAFLAFDERDVLKIASRARPDQRVVLLSRDQDFENHPQGFKRLPIEIPGLRVSLREPIQLDKSDESR